MEKFKIYCAKQYLNNHKYVWDMTEEERKKFYKSDKIMKILGILFLTYMLIVFLVNNFIGNQTLINYLCIPVLILMAITLFIILPLLFIKLIWMIICDLVTIICYKIDKNK